MNARITYVLGRGDFVLNEFGTSVGQCTYELPNLCRRQCTSSRCGRRPLADRSVAVWVGVAWKSSLYGSCQLWRDQLVQSDPPRGAGGLMRQAVRRTADSLA